MAIKSYVENDKTFYEVYVNGFDSRGRRVQKRKKCIETMRKAQTIEFDLKRELANLRDSVIPYKWGEWFEECLKRMKLTSQPSTVINYEKQLNKSVNPYWKEIEVSEITRNDVLALVFEKLGDSLNMNSKRWVLDMVRRLFQMAVEDGVIDRNPAMGIKVKVPEVDQKVLTNSEVEILLREAKICQHRFYPVWVLALLTGMRSGELFAIIWTDVDLDAKTISVNKQWTNKSGFGPTKTRKNRIVAISSDLLKFLKKLMFESQENDFVLPRLGEWENGMQAEVLREFCGAIGITPVKFHDLRATFITNLLSRGESLARVMSIVGHTQLKTTNCYLRKAGVDVQGGTDKIGYALPDDSLGNVLTLVKSS